MRIRFAGLFLLLIIAMGVCMVIARRSRKAIGASVSMLIGALIPPMIGNMVIIASGARMTATVGCYIYFLGMDIVIYAALQFTMDYCDIAWPSRALKTFVYALLAVDVVQLLLNPFFHHAFDTEAIQVDGFAYYRLIPHLGQSFHRLVDYGLLAAIVVLFIVKLARSPRIYAERYWVILLTILGTTVWESYYIFSRTPIDRSMIGFGVFGLLVFYFALYYRPMRLLDRLLAGIASHMSEALFLFDVNGRCIWANPTGRALVDIRGRDFESATARLTERFGPIDQTVDWSAPRVQGRGDDAHYYMLETHMVRDERSRKTGAFLSVRDETEEKQALRREQYAARHDLLTGLYSREYLYQSVAERLAEQPDTPHLILFADIKDFKIINDIFGNAFGDYTLKSVAAWICELLSENCLFGRLAGDMFGACMPAAEFDEALIEDRLSNFTVNDGIVEHGVLVHLGVYEVTEPDLDVSVMFDRAHMALTTIKDEYKKHIAWYDDEMRSRVLWSQYISMQLPEALAQRQVQPYLQPIVDAAGRVVGAEALVRWIHPRDGFLSPAAFIPVFEKNGRIADVDRYMWRHSCETLSRWKDTRPDLFISVNISPKDFYFMDVVAELRAIVGEYGVDPSRLRIEITETVMMTDIDNRMHMLSELRGEGFIVEIDDFGSGYSSLNMLKDMPVDVLKLDMAFLTRAEDDDKARIIVGNIMKLSEELGIASLTEGVETEAQHRMLTDMGCQLFQGYYFARPMPVDAFEAFCEERRGERA